MERAQIFIALVSPDYLHSHYCYDTEFKRALELAAAGRLGLVAIIVQPCDWKNSPLYDRLVLPHDGRPVANWPNENDAYVDVVDGLRETIKDIQLHVATPGTPKPAQVPGRPTAPMAGNLPAPAGVLLGPTGRLRTRGGFDAVDKSDFIDTTFIVIADYFKSGCQQLSAIPGGAIKARFRDMSSMAFTCTVVNHGSRDGRDAHITVRNDKPQWGGDGELTYLFQANGAEGHSNGSIRVEAGPAALHLGFMDGYTFGAQKQSAYTPVEAAAALWAVFIKQAELEYEPEL